MADNMGEGFRDARTMAFTTGRRISHAESTFDIVCREGVRSGQMDETAVTKPQTCAFI